MPTNSFGQISPQMLDPYNIETEIVKQLGGAQSSTALPMLNLYRSDRMLQGNIAAKGIEAQNEHARAALEAEIQKNMVDAINTGAERGTLEILASSPDLSRVLGNANPGALARRHAQGVDDAAATRFQKTGSGAYSALQAGFQLPNAEFARLSGANANPVTPLGLQEASIRAAGEGGGGGPRFTYQVDNPLGGGTIGVSAKNIDMLRSGADSANQYWDAKNGRGQPGAGGGAPNSSTPPPSRGADRITPPHPNSVRAVDAATTNEARNIISEMAKRNHPVAVELQKGYAGGTPPLKIENGLLQGRTKNGQWVQLKVMPQ